MIAITHELDKVVQFYDLDEFLLSTDDKLEIQPKYSFKNLKKISAITDISLTIQGQSMDGLVIGDKVGETYFLNVQNLDKLPKEIIESEVAKLLYGHQQTVTTIQKSYCGRFLVSTDTLNKVVVNNFPNVFNIQSVNTDQEKNTLKDVCLLNEDLVATISSAEDPSKSNIYISDIFSGKTLYCLDNADI